MMPDFASRSRAVEQPDAATSRDSNAGIGVIGESQSSPLSAQQSTNVTNYDLLPTFDDWAGGEPADLANVDGMSLKGILEGETPSQDLLNRSLYFHDPHYRSATPLSVVVKGTNKLVYS